MVGGDGRVKGGSRALARRYARALLEVATEPSRRGKPKPERLRAELAEAESLLQKHRDLRTVLTHPAVSVEKKRKIASAIWEKTGGSELLVRLLDLLASRDRLELLPEITREFGEAWNAARGAIGAEAVAAAPLEKAQVAALAQALGRLTGLEVELRESVDPELLGGLLVRMGGRTYDGTVRTRLRALRRQLVGA
jgi:F-type H+-transporting ATPase subunit delta